MRRPSGPEFRAGREWIIGESGAPPTHFGDQTSTGEFLVGTPVSGCRRLRSARRFRPLGGVPREHVGHVEYRCPVEAAKDLVCLVLSGSSSAIVLNSSETSHATGDQCRSRPATGRRLGDHRESPRSGTLILLASSAWTGCRRVTRHDTDEDLAALLPDRKDLDRLGRGRAHRLARFQGEDAAVA